MRLQHGRTTVLRARREVDEQRAPLPFGAVYHLGTDVAPDGSSHDAIFASIPPEWPLRLSCAQLVVSDGRAIARPYELADVASDTAVVAIMHDVRTFASRQLESSVARVTLFALGANAISVIDPALTPTAADADLFNLSAGTAAEGGDDSARQLVALITTEQPPAASPLAAPPAAPSPPPVAPAALLHSSWTDSTRCSARWRCRCTAPPTRGRSHRATIHCLRSCSTRVMSMPMPPTYPPIRTSTTPWRPIWLASCSSRCASATTAAWPTIGLGAIPVAA